MAIFIKSPVESMGKFILALQQKASDTGFMLTKAVQNEESNLSFIMQSENTVSISASALSDFKRTA